MHKKTLQWTNALEVHNLPNLLSEKESSVGAVLGTEDTVPEDTSQPLDAYADYPHLIQQLLFLGKWAGLWNFCLWLCISRWQWVQVSIPGCINGPLTLGMLKHPGKTLPSYPNEMRVHQLVPDCVPLEMDSMTRKHNVQASEPEGLSSWCSPASAMDLLRPQ